MSIPNCKNFEIEFDSVLQTKEQELSAEFAEFSQDLQQEANELEKDIPNTSGVDVVFDIDIDVEMIEQTVKFHLPVTKIENQKMSMHLPVLKTNEQTIVFHTPSTKMVRKKIGSHPETTCKTKYKRVAGVKVPYPECKTIWKPNYADIPEVFMQEQKIIIGIPEVSMKPKDLIIGVPVFDFKEHALKFDLPSIKIKQTSTERKEVKKRAEDLNNEAEIRKEQILSEFQSELSHEIVAPHTELFDCYRAGIESRRDEATKEIDAIIGSMNASIKQLKENNTDADDKYLAQVEKKRNELVVERKNIISKFDKALINLEKQQKSSLQEIINSFKNT